MPKRFQIPVGCYFLLLREEQWLKVVENGILRKTFGPQRTRYGEVVKSRSLTLCISQQTFQIKKDEMGGHVARMKDRRGAYRILVGRPEGKTPLERPRRSWKNNNKINLQEVR
jgi:hypothetical protein